MMTNKLKELREAAGMTQAQLAEAAGIKQQALSRYERGENDVKNMTVALASKIAGALNVRIEELI